MAHYIDADKLRAEIEKRMHSCDATSKTPNQLLWAELASLIPFLDTLQEEEPLPEDCELVTADEDIITIHLGKVLTEEQYDAVLRSVIDHLNKHWWHILRWSS